MGSRWTTWSPAMAVLVLSKAGLFSVKRINISTHIITGKVIRSALAWAFDKNVWRSMLTNLQAFACGKWTTYTRPLSEVVGCKSSAPTLTLNMSYLSGYLGWVPSCIMTISKSQLLKCVAPKQNLRSIKFCGLRSSPHIWGGVDYKGSMSASQAADPRRQDVRALLANSVVDYVTHYVCTCPSCHFSAPPAKLLKWVDRLGTS